ICLCCTAHLLSLHSFPARRSSDLSTRSRSPTSNDSACRSSVAPSKNRCAKSQLTLAKRARSSCSACATRRVLKATTLAPASSRRSEEHTSELQSRENLVCRLLLEN